MAKLTFPAVDAPYRGFVGEVRGWFNRIASAVDQSPALAAGINSQIAVLAAATGYSGVNPVDGPVLVNGKTMQVAYTVENGQITGLTLSN